MEPGEAIDLIRWVAEELEFPVSFVDAESMYNEWKSLREPI